jgi:hypothetical protein
VGLGHTVLKRIPFTCMYIRTGTAAVVRSYVSEATTEKERTGALAGISSSQGLGFVLGPG